MNKIERKIPGTTDQYYWAPKYRQITTNISPRTHFLLILCQNVMLIIYKIYWKKYFKMKEPSSHRQICSSSVTLNDLGILIQWWILLERVKKADSAILLLWIPSVDRNSVFIWMNFDNDLKKPQIPLPLNFILPHPNPPGELPQTCFTPTLSHPRSRPSCPTHGARCPQVPPPPLIAHAY